MKNSETKDFIAYEYLSIKVESDKEPLYIDCYENFGWILINNTALIDKEDYYLNNVNNRKVNIKFKRDRKIKNKLKLISLQKKLEICLKELEEYEKSPIRLGMVWALTIGFIATIFMAISVFAITATNPLYILCIISGIIGIIGWILPFFIYNKIKDEETEKNVSLIEEAYNSIYDYCEQAKKLIN